MSGDEMGSTPRQWFGQSLKRAVGRIRAGRLAAAPTPLPPLRSDRSQRPLSSSDAPHEDLRRTQAALEAAQLRYLDLLEYTSALYNDAPVGYLTLTPDGIIVEANLTATKLLGLTREFLLRQPIHSYLAAEDRDLFQAFAQQVLATRQPQRSELRMVRADGTRFYAQVDAAVVVEQLGMEPGRPPHDGRLRIRATLSDISGRVQLEEEERSVRRRLERTLEELRQTQAQLVQQERLAVVGQLAAGIAHDFNNILAVITLYTQLVTRSAELPASLRVRMESIALQSERATYLVQQILDFSRRTVLTRQPTGLVNYLQQIAELLQHTLPETIQISLVSHGLQAGTDDLVDIDPTRLQQVLLNLALNARDAMPTGGELRLEVARLTVTRAGVALASGSLATGAWLQIAMTDTGTGIDPYHLPRLFEPFFTTKAVGAGSGLGLAQVWGIVKQHGGEIDVISELGVGTTFALYLPAWLEAAPVPAAPEPAVIPHGQGEVVLVVEDTDMLRKALTSALEQLGYQTVAAKDGQEAATAMAQGGAQIDLILSDLIMPVMGGEELIRTLRSQGWEQPVVVVTGYPLTPAQQEALTQYGQIGWLPKPPTLPQLSLALYRALHPQSTEAAPAP